MNNSLQQNLVPNICNAIAEICEVFVAVQQQQQGSLSYLQLVFENAIWFNEYDTWKEIQVICKLPHGQVQSCLAYFPSSVPTLTKLIGCLQSVFSDPLCFIHAPLLDGWQSYSFGLDNLGQPVVSKCATITLPNRRVLENCTSIIVMMRANALTMDAVYNHLCAFFHKMCFMQSVTVHFEYFRQVPLSTKQTTFSRSPSMSNTRQQQIVKSMAHLQRCDEDAVMVAAGRRVRLKQTKHKLTCHLIAASHQSLDIDKHSHLNVQLAMYGPANYPLTCMPLPSDERSVLTNLMSLALGNFHFTSCEHSDDETGDADRLTGDVQLQYRRTHQWMIGRKKMEEAEQGEGPATCQLPANDTYACTIFIFLDTRHSNTDSAAVKRLSVLRWLRESLSDVLAANVANLKVAFNSLLVSLFKDKDGCISKRQKIYDTYIPVATGAIGDIVRSSCDLDFVRQCHQLLKVTNTRDMETAMSRRLWSIASRKFNVAPPSNDDAVSGSEEEEEQRCGGVACCHDNTAAVQSAACSAAAPTDCSAGNVQEQQLTSRCVTDFDHLTAYDGDLDFDEDDTGRKVEGVTGVNAGDTPVRGDSDFDRLMDTNDLWLL